MAPLFSMFRLLVASGRKFRQRFTTTGRFVVMGTLFAGVTGVDTTRSLAYQLFALLVSLLAVAFAYPPGYRPRLRVTRQLAGFATVGEPFSYEVTLVNLESRPYSALLLHDELAATLPTRREFATAREPGEEERNWFDRKVGFPRFLWLLQRKRGMNSLPCAVPLLPPGGSVTVRLQGVALRRGRLDFATINVASPDPLGLIHAFCRLPLPASLLVLPRRYRLPHHFRLSGRRHYQPGGITSSGSIGEAEEFIGLRDYRDGDPLKRIHWPSLAKRGAPVVKEYADEYFSRNALILDTFIATPHARLEEAVAVAASFAVTLDDGESLLDLMLVAAQATLFTSGRGVAHCDQLLELLAAVEHNPDGGFELLGGLVLEHAARLGNAILILLAWDRPRQELVASLLARGLELMVLVVVDSACALDPGPLAVAPERLLPLVVGRVEADLARLPIRI